MMLSFAFVNYYLNFSFHPFHKDFDCFRITHFTKNKFLTAVFLFECILQLMVQAKVLNTDLEHNLLSSVVPVFINVSDVDDNYPRFVQRSYR